MRRQVCVMLAVFLGGLGLPGHASAPRVDGDLYRIRVVLDGEVFRPGGPRQERVEELLEQAIAAGNPRIVAEVLDGIANMARRRWIRIAPLEPLFGELERIGERASTGEGSGLARGFQRLLELERLGEQGRRELYRGLLKSEQRDSHFLLTWELAAYDAILEGMDDLLPEIEAAISSNAISAFGRNGLDSLNSIALPLARARQGDWVAGHLVLFRRLVTDPSKATTRDRYSEEGILARELVAALAQNGGERALEGLLDIWRVLPAQEFWGDQQTWSSAHAEDIAAGKVDPECPHAGPLADLLQLAIREMGRPHFQEKNLASYYFPSPTEAEAELKAKGVLKQTSAREP